MIEYRLPHDGEEAQLRRIWKDAFRESGAFVDLFMDRGYGLDRCVVAVAGGRIAGMLYWFDCDLDDRPVAYLYGIATDPMFQKRGVASGLVAFARDHLQSLGYTGTVLVPGGPELFRFYERLGYRTVGYLDEFQVRAGDPAAIRELTPQEYAVARNEYLPENGIRQDVKAMEFFHGFARFYRGADFLAAVSREAPLCYEFLGNRDRVPGLLAALGIREGMVRTPGNTRSFAMAMWFGDGPNRVHFGLAFD